MKSDKAKASRAELVAKSPITAAAKRARRRRGKRTQDERSTEMRARLIDATIACLSTRGYARTSLGAIAEQAGVSRGAVQHHYPEKDYLVAAALEASVHHAAQKVIAGRDETSNGPERLNLLLDSLWRANCSPPMPAAADIRVAARTNDALREMLVPFEHGAREKQRALIIETAGPGAGIPDRFEARVEALLGTMRGLALSLSYGWQSDEIEAAWSIARDDFLGAFEFDET